MSQTHWKKLTDPNYLGSWDFAEGEERILTISKVEQEKPAMELRNPFDEMEAYRKHCERQKQNRQYGQDPQPSWVGVGAMSIICMIVGFILGVGI